MLLLPQSFWTLLLPQAKRTRGTIAAGGEGTAGPRTCGSRAAQMERSLLIGAREYIVQQRH